MKKISNKGFTLIELLVTILIIGLVLGITTYGIISSVNKAKEKSTVLSLAGIKEAARTYSGELGEESWKNISDYEDTYFCVTIEELINKGLLNKNAKSIENGGKIVDYVVVIKNKTTKVIKKEEILTEDNEDNLAYNICTGNIKNEVITSKTKIDKTTSYTDSVDINFTDAVFESGITERYCEYGESSTNLNSKGTITDKTCSLDGLVKNKNYYTRVCMVSQRESVSCSDTITVTTKNIIAPTIAIDTNKNNSVKINYDNSNIKGDSYYYFKSTINGTSSINVSTCSLDDNKYSCNNDSVNNIIKNTWYKVSNKEISITYSTSGNITVTAETRDKSDNSNSSTKEFSLYKTTFNRGTADTIGGQTNNIELMCLANKGKTCSITSPSIEKAGYQAVGWNTSSSATTSSWNVNTSKSINSTKVYYPILKQATYTITYDNNGGSGCTTKSVAYNSQIGSLCTPSRKGYTFIGWYNSDYKDSPLNYYADTYSDLYDAFGYDADKLYNHYLTYGVNENRRISQYISTDIYNYSSNKTIYAGWKINKVNIRFNTKDGIVTSSTTTASGNTYKWMTDSNGLISRTNANGDTYSSDFYSINYGGQTGSDGLINYNNSKYLNVTRKGYSAVSGSEWKCQSGCTTSGKKFNQASIYSASDFCDASSSNCTVTLGVNWTPNTYKIIYNANGGSGSISDVTATYDKTVSINTSGFTREGYTFTGWTTNSDGSDDGYGWTGWSGTWKYVNGQYGISNGKLNLYAKWRRNTVTIKFSVNGGTLNSGAPYSVDSNGIVTRDGKDLYTMYYNDTIVSTGLPNYDNSSYLDINKTDYIAVSGEEWKCLSGNCVNSAYSQDTNTYKASDFCDASSGDCSITVGVNWEKYKVIDDYRCVGSDFYYITFCRGDKCYYNRKNCQYDISGTLDWSSVKDCVATTVNKDRCIGENTYFITTCTAAKCNYNSKNGVSSTGVIYDRCSLYTNCVKTKTMYITATSGLNCRSGAGTSYGIVTSYACGTAIKVRTEPTDNWYYSTEDNCYASGTYLSETTPNCSSGGSGSSGGGSGSSGGGSDDSSGFLASCTCNTISDCGVSGTNIKVWCDKTRESGATSGGKYMCAWQNRSSSGGFNNSPKRMCW